MDAGSLARSVVSGIISVPTDFYHGLERTMQDMKLSDGRSRTQQRNFKDDVRFYHAVLSVINDRSTIGDIVGIIIEDALNDLPDEALEKIHDAIVGKATAVASRTAMQLAVSSWLGAKVVSGLMGPVIARLSMRFVTGMLTGGIVAQGVVARACESSRRLQLNNPALWQRLRPSDYDLLYFLFEEPLKKFSELKKLKSNPVKLEEFVSAL